VYYCIVVQSGYAVWTWSCAVACCGGGTPAAVRWQVDVQSQCRESVLKESTGCCRQMEILLRPLVSAAVFRTSARGQDCPATPQTRSTQCAPRISTQSTLTKVHVWIESGCVMTWVTANALSLVLTLERTYVLLLKMSFSWSRDLCRISELTKNLNSIRR